MVLPMVQKNITLKPNTTWYVPGSKHASLGNPKLDHSDSAMTNPQIQGILIIFSKKTWL
jgi:hypothetical protein